LKSPENFKLNPELTPRFSKVTNVLPTNSDDQNTIQKNVTIQLTSPHISEKKCKSVPNGDSLSKDRETINELSDL
jgi:hypothetical protein